MSITLGELIRTWELKNGIQIHTIFRASKDEKIKANTAYLIATNFLGLTDEEAQLLADDTSPKEQAG